MSNPNEAFGWLLIGLGFASGALMGLYFDRESWLGGYVSYRRRLVRLGHIALVALGAVNILFGLSLSRAQLGPAQLGVASWALMIGGIAMPVSCGVTAWSPRMKPLFAIPVISLIAGVGLLIWGLVRA